MIIWQIRLRKRVNVEARRVMRCQMVKDGAISKIDQVAHFPKQTI